ncbi:MAG: flagellar protein FliJ [Clostridiales bacterium]|nr:flagellar protein FliJ [Clostridiales bacterium]
MKKFVFSLDHMRDYKDLVLDEERGILAQLNAKRNTLQQQIDALQQRFCELSQELKDAQQQGTTIQKIRSYGVQLENIRLQLADLRVLLLAAEQEVEKQMAVVLAANQEVSKLDKLHDKQYDLYQKQVKKVQEQQVEELISMEIGRENAV